MSFLTQFKDFRSYEHHAFRNSVTLFLNDLQSLDPHGSFKEFEFDKNPYTSIPSSEFSISAVLASGGHPSQVFVASNDIDSVLNSVDNLQKTLIHEIEKETK